MSSMLSAFVPMNSMNTTGNSVSSASTVNATRSDVSVLRSAIEDLTKRIDAGVNNEEVSELKKFSEFLKFRIDALDTRVSAVEKANTDINSKMNIIEITMTALSAVLKTKASAAE